MSTYRGSGISAHTILKLNACRQALVPMSGRNTLVELSMGTVLSVYPADNREHVVVSLISHKLTEADIKESFLRPVFIVSDKHPAGQWDIVTGFRNNKVRGFRMFQKYDFSKCQFFDSEV